MSAFPFREFEDYLDFTLKNPLAIQAISRHDLPKGGKATFLGAGILLLEPQNSETIQQDLVLSVGVHGNETGPIEIVTDLLQQLFTGELTLGNRVLVIYGNPPAMNKGERFVEENLNRLFGEKNDGQCYEAKRAKELMRAVRSFYEQGSHERLHYDLHTAIRGSQYEKFALYPYIPNRRLPEKQVSFLQESGVDTILLNQHPSQTFSHFTSENMKAESFTIELGAVKPFGQNDLSKFSAVKQTLQTLITSGKYGEKSVHLESLNLFKVANEVIRHSDQFEFYVEDDVKNFTAYPKGELIAKDEGYEYRVEHEHEYLIFPNKNVQNGHRAAVMLIRVQLGEQ